MIIIWSVLLIFSLLSLEFYLADNEEKIFNTNCSNICLTNAMRKVCQLSVEEKLDLISLTGQPAYIFQKPDNERVHCLLQSRESYIAAKVEGEIRRTFVE